MYRNAWLVGFVFALGISACGSDMVCPGHIDPSGQPSATIRVADGSASIAAVQVVEGPCAATLNSYWGVDAMAVASVAVSLRSDAGNGCLIEVFSSAGQCELVMVTISTYPASTTPQYHCFDNSDCCEKSAVVAVTWPPRSTIAPYETDVSFGKNPCPGSGETASLDGGALDASVQDGGAMDRAID
jgi:hypothetical protein